jgi:uncharacterized membrane protein
MPTKRRAERLLLVDALRGLAIVLMVAFHFCFDLAHFGLADFDFYSDAFWLYARTFILSLFLLLVGAGLWLASRDGLNIRRYLRRLLMIVLAALLVSVSTWWLFGERMVFFGVLHFIALASVLGLLFVRAGVASLLLGLGLIALPLAWQSDWFDVPGRRWIGMMSHKPATEDYVPLLPWFGVVLIGIYIAPWLLRLAQNRISIFETFPGRLLALAGRHSLLIYLLHQPLMFGSLAAYRQLTGA